MNTNTLQLQNETEVQGIQLTDLVKEYGSPLYVYDTESIEYQYKKLVGSFNDTNIRIKYATKALSNISILKYMNKIGIGLDVVSIEELKIGIKAGYAAKEIMYTPSCVDFLEIEEVISLGATLNLDSIPFVEKFGMKYGSSVPLCIRINPHVEAGGNHKIKTGHIESKFGISIDQLDQVYSLVDKYKIDMAGIHVHTGSDFGDIDVFLKVAELMYEVAMNFKNLRFLDFGSGFKVAYKKGDKETNIEELGSKMSASFAGFCKRYGKKLELWFEPGKYLVSKSGYLLAQATVIKPTPATTFIGLNTGLNHLIRPMMYESYHEIINISNPEGPKQKYSVVGYICETDTFAWEREMTETKEGDVLAFKNAGAYGFSMSSNYNSRIRPAEVMIYKGKAVLIRKRETLEDVLKNQIEINF